jgi:hypothetical protein
MLGPLSVFFLANVFHFSVRRLNFASSSISPQAFSLCQIPQICLRSSSFPGMFLCFGITICLCVKRTLSMSDLNEREIYFSVHLKLGYVMQGCQGPSFLPSYCTLILCMLYSSPPSRKLSILCTFQPVVRGSTERANRYFPLRSHQELVHIIAAYM